MKQWNDGVVEYWDIGKEGNDGRLEKWNIESRTIASDM
jgi:hypothetical protein